MTLLRRALLRATLTATTAACLVIDWIGFTNPVLLHAVVN